MAEKDNNFYQKEFRRIEYMLKNAGDKIPQNDRRSKIESFIEGRLDDKGNFKSATFDNNERKFIERSISYLENSRKIRNGSIKDPKAIMSWYNKADKPNNPDYNRGIS
ncbi:MAG TPA: hypothetical protein DIV86_01860 [Alphaproteobacteria bacterium]|nr:hypothetical protein [Alphaproteobacteria bacterium]